MTTLAELADAVQVALKDSAEAMWTQAEIEAFVLNAISAYSIHFPLTAFTTITAVAGQNVYDLPGDCINTQAVEFPKDEDPPQYLTRRRYTQPGWWRSDRFYDVVQLGDATDYSQIWISADADGTEEITIEYQACHPLGLSSGDDVTVPAHHLHIVILMTAWIALNNLAVDAAKSSSGANVTYLDQLRRDAEMAEKTYNAAIANAQAAQSESAVTSWRMDRFSA